MHVLGSKRHAGERVSIEVDGEVHELPLADVERAHVIGRIERGKKR